MHDNFVAERPLPGTLPSMALVALSDGTTVEILTSKDSGDVNLSLQSPRIEYL